MTDEPCMCGTPFTCVADDHDAAVAVGIARADAAVHERMRWEKALTDSALPNIYVRLVRDLALAPCGNCGGHIAYCDCDES